MRWIIFILCLVQYQVHAFDWLNRTVRVDFIDSREARTQFESIKPSPEVITGGIDATNGQYPWTILTRSSSPGGQGILCSGTIISSTFFITDLSCMGQQLMPPANSMEIYVGSVQWSVFRPPPEHFVRHFWHIAPSPENSPNIALCRIHVPLTFTPNVQPIRLPYAANSNFTYDGWSSIILGYRLEAPLDRLQFVPNIIFNNNVCDFFDSSIGDHELCGPAGDDPHVNGSTIRFTGFTGGAWMVYEYAPDYDLHPVVIGINHYQYANQTGSYGLGTRVSHFVEWIQSLTGGLFS